MGWSLFFEEFPPGWQEDQRAAIIVASSGAKIDPEKIFPSLATIYKRKNAFKSSAFYHFALNAKGGDKFDFLED